MNRRNFLQSLVAVISLPATSAFSLRSAATAMPMTTPMAATVPANARFWAIYMSGLHGECTPKALQNMLNIPASDAKRYISHLISDGVIKPNPLLKRTVSKLVKSHDDSFFDSIKKRLDMKSRNKIKTMEEADARDEYQVSVEEIEVLEDTATADEADSPERVHEADGGKLNI